MLRGGPRKRAINQLEARLPAAASGVPGREADRLLSPARDGLAGPEDRTAVAVVGDHDPSARGVLQRPQGGKVLVSPGDLAGTWSTREDGGDQDHHQQSDDQRHGRQRGQEPLPILPILAKHVLPPKIVPPFLQRFPSVSVLRDFLGISNRAVGGESTPLRLSQARHLALLLSERVGDFSYHPEGWLESDCWSKGILLTSSLLRPLGKILRRVQR